jgi:predicted ATPase/DNA-binding SARP family transcriptional activator
MLGKFAAEASVTDDLRIRLLGGFAASAGPRTVPLGAWRLRKARSLVKLLALAPGHALHRDQLADILWPDLGGDAARNNLHQAVFAARRALSSIGVDGSAVLGNRDDLLVLGSGLPVVVDVEELQGAVREAQAAGRRDLVARVLVESPGELLPEDAYEPWAQGPATAFREWRTQAVLDVAQAQLGDGEADQAVVLLAPVISADPLHEPAARTMMRALAASGRRSEALIGYERLRDTLREELGAEPESATRDLFRELLAAESTGPDPGPLPRTRAQGNLPAAMTSLIGRSRELEETRAILARTRLLTLTGMGGAGKTALALELARRCTADFPSGAHLVELGALTHREQVAPHIARTLQVELPANSPPVTSLIGQLRHWQVLLVLDNCEHLLDECAQVTTALLRGCPDLHVLATSREALRIEGEVSWRTPSLDLPDPQGSASPQELARIASVELFVRRAAAAVPGFALNGDNASAVAEICYRLDGIPLALELAAACIPVLSPQQIAARLGDALNLLRRGDRATITRQQTLEAALAWSHDLLGDEERVLFRRLSVFAGSFTLPAVEAVCSGDLRPPEVLGALARLVDASLVVADVAGAVTRYRLLETVRQYAALRQRAAAEPLDLPSLHCDWYLQLALARDLEGARTRAAPLTSLDVEHDNLRAAMSWSLQHRSDRALELAVALWRYWLARGFFVEGRRWLEAALAAAPAPTSLRARALVALAVFDVRRGIGTRIAALGD